MRNSLHTLVLISLVNLTACSSMIPEQRGDPRFAPTIPARPHHTGVHNGSIYSEGNAITLFETQRARHVGDILTVNLEERFTGAKKASSTGRKLNNTNVSNATTFGQPFDLGNGKNLAFELNSTTNFNGEGESKLNNTLNGTISVTVFHVLANGDMKVRGEKWLKINQGEEFVRLTGTVRPADVRPDNTISSLKIANARIEYSGVGQIDDNNRQGWLARFFVSRWWPY